MRSQLNKAATRLKLALGGGFLLHLLTAALGTSETLCHVGVESGIGAKRK
jgi:hypothetical protein